MKLLHVIPILMIPMLLAVSGCSKQIRIKSLEPAQINRAAGLKRIAVLTFKHDTPGLSGKIETLLSQKRLDEKPYFTIINRKDIRQIIREQKRQYSGLLNEKKSVELGNLLGAQALITGNITSATKQDSHFYETRIECADKSCKKLRTYPVRCVKRRVNLSANIRMADVSKGDIVYSDSLSDTRTWSHCIDDSRSIPSLSNGLDLLANNIARRFVYKLTPNYQYTNVTLLEDPDTNYNNQQQQWLKNGLAFVEANRLDKAQSIFEHLYQQQPNSYVAAYNSGIVKEAQGQYQEAQTYFKIADKLQTKPIDEINQAVNRIQLEISQLKRANQQIKER
jgi:curli biogenesis system outer membrane secretion channel CsgG